MGIEIIKDIKKLIELLSSPFKKNFSGEYYKNKNIKSIFYFNDHAQIKSTLNELEKHPTLKKAQAQYIQNNNSQNIAEVIIQPKVSPKQAKKIENLISEFNTENSRQPNVSIESSIQKLELPKKSKPLNSPYRDVSSIISCNVKELDGGNTVEQQVVPKKLNNNPNFLEFKQELESRLKNLLESNSESDALLGDKNKEQKQACREDVLPLASSSEDAPILPVETEIKPIVFSGNMPPPPPPIEGLANFKRLKLPLSSPMQEQNKTKQEKFCNVSQSKVNIRPNVNNAFVDELTLKLEQRKNKAHSV